jgi:hypothetical protein
MLPNPTTMRFAWDADVLHGTRVLISILVLAVALVFGGAAMMDDGREGTTAAIAASPHTQISIAAR